MHYKYISDIIDAKGMILMDNNYIATTLYMPELMLNEYKTICETLDIKKNKAANYLINRILENENIKYSKDAENVTDLKAYIPRFRENTLRKIDSITNNRSLLFREAFIRHKNELSSLAENKEISQFRVVTFPDKVKVILKGLNKNAGNSFIRDAVEDLFTTFSVEEINISEKYSRDYRKQISLITEQYTKLETLASDYNKNKNTKINWYDLLSYAIIKKGGKYQ